MKTNAVVIDREKEAYFPRWKDATIVHQGLTIVHQGLIKAKRKAMEVAVITTSPNINTRPGPLRLAKITAQSLVIVT